MQEMFRRCGSRPAIPAVLCATAFAAFLSCENPGDPEPWPDGAYLYLGSASAETSLAWSPYGSIMTFTSLAFTSPCIYGFDGLSEPSFITSSTYDESTGPNGSWSAEQGRILYTAGLDDSLSQVRSIPGNIGAVKLLLDDGRRHLHPTWVAGGDSVVLCTLEDGYWGLWKAEYDEGGLEPSLLYGPEADCLRPSLSPDGSWILFQRREGDTSDIWLIRPDGSEPTAVVTGASDDIHPCWGPDSDRFAFSSDRSGNYDIWISDLTGDSLVQVTQDDADDMWPAWNPEHGWLVFSSTRASSDFDVFSIDL